MMHASEDIEGNSRSIRGLFKSYRPAIVTDSEFVRHTFCGEGFDVLSLDAVCSGDFSAPDDVILITCEAHKIPDRRTLKNAFDNSAVLIIPLLSFSYSNEDVLYLSKILFDIDFQAACVENLKLVEKLERTVSPIYVSSGGSKLTVELSLSL